MIKIDFYEPNDVAWLSWRQRCNKAQSQFNTKMEVWRSDKVRKRPAANPKLYTNQKHAFYVTSGPPFYGKCIYCETSLLPGMHGDLDHFRPKGRVTDRDGTNIAVEIDGIVQEHPGYYWLAYDWRNLLPSCQLCNQPSIWQQSGEHIGKWDYFPIIDSYRACKPGEEIQERPLLINPLHEDPAQHLTLEPGGTMNPLTERGAACIEVFGLNVRGLKGYRKEAYEETQRLVDALEFSMRYAPHSERTRDLRAKLQRIKDGQERHTMAARLAIADAFTFSAYFQSILRNP